MDESKTSITEDIHRQMHTEPWSVCYEIMLEHARDLQRELAAVKKALLQEETEHNATMEQLAALRSLSRPPDQTAELPEEPPGILTSMQREYVNALRAAAEELHNQLPEGMKHCTILVKQCKKGHGWLTATNWIDHGCPTCRSERAEQRLAEAEKAVAAREEK